MTLVQYTAEVRNGRLLELPTEADALNLIPGDKIQVQLDFAPTDPLHSAPNGAMLEALRQIAELQKDMPYTDGSTTLKLVREARSGAMYGYDPSE